MILVSDGGSNCSPPSPCQAAKTLAGGGVDLRIEAIGFQVADQARRQLECIAAAGDGAYRDAQDAGELADTLQSLSVRALRRFDASGIPISRRPGRRARDRRPQAGPVPGLDRAQRVALLQGPGRARPEARRLRDRDRPHPRRPRPFARFEVEITNPDGDLVDSDSNNGVGGESVSSVATTDQITEPETSDFGDKPGDYLVTLTLDDPDGILSGRRYPVEMLVRLKGTKVNPAPAEATEAKPEDKAPAAKADDGPGALTGSVAAIILARRGRRVRDRRRGGAAPQGGDVIARARRRDRRSCSPARPRPARRRRRPPPPAARSTPRRCWRAGRRTATASASARSSSTASSWRSARRRSGRSACSARRPRTSTTSARSALSLATPLREDLVFDDDNSDFNGRTAASVQAETDTVVGEGVEGADSDVAVPGTYYAVLRFTNLFREESSSRLRVYEFPLDVTVTVTGEPQPDVPLPAVDAELNAPQPTTEEKPAEEDEGAALLTGAEHRHRGRRRRGPRGAPAGAGRPARGLRARAAGGRLPPRVTREGPSPAKCERRGLADCRPCRRIP